MVKNKKIQESSKIPLVRHPKPLVMPIRQVEVSCLVKFSYLRRSPVSSCSSCNMGTAVNCGSSITSYNTRLAEVRDEDREGGRWDMDGSSVKDLVLRLKVVTVEN